MLSFYYFFFNNSVATEIYTLSLHDALPIFGEDFDLAAVDAAGGVDLVRGHDEDRKSTRLNSSHVRISYAVFCLKKKKKLAARADHYECWKLAEHHKSVDS